MSGAKQERPVHYRTLIDNEWLGGWDLPEGNAVVVVIESVNRYEPRQKKRKRNPRTGQLEDEPNTKLDIGFKGKRKRFLANKTNQKVIAKMYGPYVKDWIGKPIGIYFDPTVEFGKEVVGGIRVSPRIPGGNARPTDDPLDGHVDEQRAGKLEDSRAQDSQTQGREPGED